MRNRRKTAILIAIAIISAAMFVSAIAEDLITRYTYITAISAGLSISGSSASANGGIIPSGNYATNIVVKLQQRQSNGRWVTIASWSGNNSSGVSEAGGTATITAGYSYRTYVVGHVYDSNGNIIDTGTAYKY